MTATRSPALSAGGRVHVAAAIICYKREVYASGVPGSEMIALLLWLLLLVFCWPLALLALVLYPLVWLLSLPLRLVGIAVEGVFALLRALILLPARVLGGRVR